MKVNNLNSLNTSPKVKEEKKIKSIENKKLEEAPKVDATQKIALDLKVPTAAVPTIAGKTYRVQIGAFSAKPKIEGVSEISTVVLDNGITKYFSGNFSNYEEAVKRKKSVLEKGFTGAFIVSFQDGKIVK